MWQNLVQLMRLARELSPLVRRMGRVWWRVDRIRVSPVSGRLLHLQPGSGIEICGRPGEILERRVEMAPDRSRVVYLCRERPAEERDLPPIGNRVATGKGKMRSPSGRTGELIIECQSTSPGLRLFWSCDTTGGTIEPLAETDVQLRE